ncbi:BLUF domain-containing protein [Variovorax sp. J22G73]|uniref:BLUF domain-containing protein n=1 Tax=unclassified Variovorax TaxID=663243 RepID=UPI002577CC66|nr:MULTISPECIES: BLUF domain-containing protein [unclassified Variovorax]MDM0010580.1 BLUF domain-containing protein [Variovorax sp. J22R203]MDM0103091.1 BLUF domain-containing protein [Variovorax sp. J22G73]
MPEENSRFEIFELLYTSQDAMKMTVQEARKLAKSASVQNAKLGITGMLVFDGERFCQHLEGAPEAIRKMFEKILRDPRHADIRVLVSGSSNLRKFKNFSMGFASLGDVDLLRELVVLEGDRAMRAFAGLVPLIEIK